MLTVQCHTQLATAGLHYKGQHLQCVQAALVTAGRHGARQPSPGVSAGQFPTYQGAAAEYTCQQHSSITAAAGKSSIVLLCWPDPGGTAFDMRAFWACCRSTGMAPCLMMTALMTAHRMAAICRWMRQERLLLCGLMPPRPLLSTTMVLNWFRERARGGGGSKVYTDAAC